MAGILTGRFGRFCRLSKPWDLGRDHGLGHEGLMGINLHDYQTTVKSCATLSGVGVHNGKPVTVRFMPAEPDTGIVFVHNGDQGAGRQVAALASEVGATA